MLTKVLKNFSRIISNPYNLDKKVASIGIIISSVVLIFGGIHSKSIALFQVGGLSLISCLLYLAMRNNIDKNFNFFKSRSNLKFWTFIFFALYILSLLTIYFRSDLYERPLIYFVLVSLMAGSIACGTLSAKRNYIWLILCQIILLGINIGWTNLLIVPSLIGSDPWYHSALTMKIIDTHFIPDGFVYSYLPLFHLIVAITSLITAFSYKYATMFSVSFGQIICNTLFVFLITNYIFKSFRIGLLAALLITIANMQILFSYWLIPNGFGGIFLLITLYLFFIKYKAPMRTLTSIMVIILMVTIILTHTIVAICMAILLFIAWGSFSYRQQFSQSSDIYKTYLFPLGFSITMLAYWIYISGSLSSLVRIIKDFINIETIKFIQFTIPTVPHTEELLVSLFGTYLFFSLSIIGVLYMISQKGDDLSFTLAIVSVTPLLISFTFYIGGNAGLESRWFYIAQILLSIPLAMALYLLGTWKIKRQIFLNCYFFGIVTLLCFLMIISPAGSNDNNTFYPITGIPRYYTQSEMIGSDFFAQRTIGVISSDYHYLMSTASSIYEHFYGISRSRFHWLDESFHSGTFNHVDSIKKIRSRHITQFQSKGFLSSGIHPDIDSYLSNSGFSKIYDNPTITGYIS
jgi:hypothetical protein